MGSDWPGATQLEDKMRGFSKGRINRELGDCDKKPSQGERPKHRKSHMGGPTVPSAFHFF